MERRLQSYAEAETEAEVAEVGRVLFRHPRSVSHQA
jgi:hypothetical protein